MAQNIINYGESPNDGEGDSLRTAFIKTDDNFDQIWATGPVGSNVTILNNTIGVVNTNGNLILSPNGIGVIQTNSKLVPRIPNTYDLGSPNLRYRTAYIGTGGLDVSGNIVIAGGLELDGDVVIDGNLTVNGNDTYINMANLVSINVGSNANVNWQFNQTGNLTLPNIANPSINYANGEPYVSTGSGGVTQSDAAPAGPTPSTLWWDEVSGRLYVYYTDADGSQWVDASPAATGSTYGNANVAAYLTTYTGNLAAGNLTVSSGSDSWTMTGQFLTGPGGAYWHSHPEQSSDDFVSAPGSDIRIQSIDADSVVESQISLTGIDIELVVVNGVTKTWRFTESGISEIPGDIVPILPLGATANVGNITNPWDNAYISGNIESGNVSAVGNITANYFIGNGSLLTGLASSYGNADVAANLAAFGSNPISTTGSITSSSLSAINLVINSITSDDSSFVNISDGVNVNGEILATGNITGSNIGITGGSLTWANASIVQTSASDVSITGDGQVTIRSLDGTYQWTFDTAGNVTIPGNIVGAATIDIDNRASGNGADIQLFAADDITLQARDRSAGSTTEGGDINIFAGNSAEDGDTSAGDIVIEAGRGGASNIDFGGSGGFVRVEAGDGGDAIGANFSARPGGSLTLNAGHAGSNNGNIDLGAAGANVYIGAGDSTGNGVNGGTIYLTSGAADASALAGDVVIQAGGTWTFDGAGNLSAPGNVSAVGNITADYFIGDGSQLTGITANTGNVTFSNQIVLGTGTNDGSGGLYLAPGTDSIANSAVQYLRVRGGDYPTHIHLDTGNNAYYDQYFGADTKYVKLEANGNIVINADDGANSATWTFDNTGNLTAPGNVSVAGNVTGGNLITAGSGGNITMTGGNILGANVVTANSFVGNGATLSNVATQITGSWTVTAGTNNYSFTLPINNTYQLWVLGNIPNGIIVYNATVSVSNTNVPVIGQQFAWNYEGGGNILMFTSIPAQIVGTAGTISNAAPAVANTSVFTFGINNTSGNTVTVNYGYTKIS
jgi:hypothetical protein